MSMKNLTSGYCLVLAFKKKTIVARMTIAAILAAICSCATRLPLPTESDASRSSISIAELQSSHHLYVKKCGGCHALIAPASLSEENWRKHVPPMAKKSKLNSEEEALILRYVLAMRESTK